METQNEEKKPKKYSSTEAMMTKYPIIKQIKEELKDKGGVSADQIRGYCRRLDKSRFLEIHVQMIALHHRSSKRRLEMVKELRKEKEALENSLKVAHDKYQKAENACLEEFGEKSYEYQQIFVKPTWPKFATGDQSALYPEVAKK